LLAVALLWTSVAQADPVGWGDSVAKPAKKKCKKGRHKAAATKTAAGSTAAVAKKKCKKKPVAPVTATPPATGSGNPPPPPPPPPDTRTTEQKIDDAVASGAITAEQGLIYKVFAAFGDPRLPPQYAGVPDALAEAPLDDVTAQWNQLSDGAKATLGPFLIPPYHEGSYWQQQIEGASAAATRSAEFVSPRADDPNSPWCVGNPDIAFQDWHFVEADSGGAAGKVRIWYQDRYAATDGPLAGTLTDAMESKIWPALTTLMQRETLPDGGSTGPCGGGSDALDIALVDAGTATTKPTGLSSESTPTNMVFPRTLPGGPLGWAGFPPYLAHEFMHVLQYTYSFSSGDLSSGENLWLKEGTAQWVQDYVSDGQYGVGLAPDQTEHKALRFFFPFPEKSLDYSANHHDYASYVFWLWAVRKGNDPTLVRQVWNAVASQKSLNAAKSLFGGGWAQAWKDFTRANWNKDPIGDYQDWDDIHDMAKVAGEVTLPNSFSNQNVFVDPVAAKYLKLEPDSGVNVLTYRNVAPLSDEAGVQAIITYKDDTKATEDWTQIAQQDVPMCNIKELILVFSNASITPGDAKVFPISWSPPSPGGGPNAGVRPRAANVCVPEPQGSFSGTGDYDNGFGTTLHYSWIGTVDFDPFGPGNPWFPEYSTEVWDSATVVSGSVTLSGNGMSVGSDETCTIDIPADTYEFGAGDGTMMIQPGPEPHYGIQLNFPANQLPEATISCPDSGSSTIPFTPPGHLIYTLEPEQASVRGTYAGSATVSQPPNLSESYTWNLSDPSQ
jgi:hypothetical protein